MDPQLQRSLKNQLLEFVEDLNEPFSARQLASCALQFIDHSTIWNTLCELEEEGKLLFLGDGRFISMKTAMRKWIACEYTNIQIYEDDFERLQFYILSGILPHKSVKEFVIDAIERFFEKKRD